MPVRELVSKLLMFIVVVIVSVGAGVLLLQSARAPQDSFTAVTGWTMVGVGGLCAIYGVLSIAVIARDSRRHRAEGEVHLTPRNGPPVAPPAWGMSDVGRPENGGVEINRMGGIRMAGSGQVRVVGLNPGLIQSLDAPMLIGVLLVWTLIAVIHFAPMITNTPLPLH